MNARKAIIAVGMAVVVLAIAIGVGSVFVHPKDTLAILISRLPGQILPETITELTASIVLKIRLPRVLMAFFVGASLSLSGTVMQAVLRNPLASSYTLGVASGGALGAALVIVLGINFFGLFTLPIVGFVFGLSTVLFAMGLTRALDQSLENNTIILVGIVFTQFVNALLTLVTAFSNEHLQQLIFWQMGSFAGNGYAQVLIVLGVLLVCLMVLSRYTWEMDLMSFGEEQALSSGVDLKRVKMILIGMAVLACGTAVAFTGTVGFVDLIAPHVMRRLFGPKHKLVLPFAAISGGMFMVVADLISRTVLAPRELPVGAVTALVGAPFFAYIYFSRRKKALEC